MTLTRIRAQPQACRSVSCVCIMSHVTVMLSFSGSNLQAPFSERVLTASSDNRSDSLFSPHAVASLTGSWSPAGINKPKPLRKVTRAPLPNAPTRRGGREMSYWSARESSRWTSGNRTSSSLLRDGVFVIAGDTKRLDLVYALPGEVVDSRTLGVCCTCLRRSGAVHGARARGGIEERHTLSTPDSFAGAKSPVAHFMHSPQVSWSFQCDAREKNAGRAEYWRPRQFLVYNCGHLGALRSIIVKVGRLHGKDRSSQFFRQFAFL